MPETLVIQFYNEAGASMYGLLGIALTLMPWSAIEKNNKLGSCQLSNASQPTGVRGEMPPSLTVAAANFAWHVQIDVLLFEPVQSPLDCNGMVE